MQKWYIYVFWERNCNITNKSKLVKLSLKKFLEFPVSIFLIWICGLANYVYFQCNVIIHIQNRTGGILVGDLFPYFFPILLVKRTKTWIDNLLLETGSDEIIYWLGRYSFLLGSMMSKKRERLHTELSIRIYHKLFGFFGNNKTQKARVSTE